MRPLTVITAILLGSSAAIAVSLGAVFTVFLILGDEYPRLRYEYRPLRLSLFIFLGMTAISALSFYVLITGHRHWMWSQLVLWLAVAGTGWYYWP